jgi:NADPH:quinone reductase-like Zn-dependent oxidoreductase
VSVRAAVLREHGAAPQVEQRARPDAAAGQVLVDVAAAPITPLDVLCATGTSYFGPPALPYVPGVQGVGTVLEADGLAAGTPVWFATSAGMAPGDGSLATVVRVPERDVVALEHDVAPVLVAALGLSAVAAERALLGRGALQPGETVVVLGAGGVVGQVAVQLARLHGAARVVAGCRSDTAAERALRAGAAAVVRLDTDDVAELAARFTDACGGAAQLVVDPLFGVPAAAAALALSEGGRLVNLGSSAGPTAVLDSAALRSRSLSVLGYTNNALTQDERRAALSAVVAHAARGELVVDHEVVALSEVAAAWRRQAQGRADRRLVVDLRAPDRPAEEAP